VAVLLALAVCGCGEKPKEEKTVKAEMTISEAMEASSPHALLSGFDAHSRGLKPGDGRSPFSYFSQLSDADELFQNGQSAIAAGIIETVAEMNKAGFQTDPFHLLSDGVETAKAKGDGIKRDFGMFLLLYRKGRIEGRSHVQAVASAAKEWK